MGEEKICGTCRWHIYDVEISDWICCSKNSDNYCEYTYYDNACDDWKERNLVDKYDSIEFKSTTIGIIVFVDKCKCWLIHEHSGWYNIYKVMESPINCYYLVDTFRCYETAKEYILNEEMRKDKGWCGNIHDNSEILKGGEVGE